MKARVAVVGIESEGMTFFLGRGSLQDLSHPSNDTGVMLRW